MVGCLVKDSQAQHRRARYNANAQPARNQLAGIAFLWSRRGEAVGHLAGFGLEVRLTALDAAIAARGFGIRISFGAHSASLLCQLKKVNQNKKVNMAARLG